MSLSPREPRRYKKPQRADAARRELERVLAVRGKPINRRRGMKPSAAFRAAAGAYILNHHDDYCYKFARDRSARHVPLEDMVQACRLGAYIALERFDAEHETAYRFLSYAKWYMLCETNRLLHKEEPLVAVPQKLKETRAWLAARCPADLSDDEAAEMIGVTAAEVRAARELHLGNEHRVVDERSRACRRSLAEVQAGHDHRAGELRRDDRLDAALARLPDLLQQALWAEYEVGRDLGLPEPRSEGARRALRRLALRRLREEMEHEDEVRGENESEAEDAA